MRIAFILFIVVTLGLYVVPKGYGDDFVSRIKTIHIDDQQLDPRNSNQIVTLNSQNPVFVRVEFSDGQEKFFVLHMEHLKKAVIPTSTPQPTPIMGQACNYGEEKFEGCTRGCYNNCGDASYFICSEKDGKRVWDPNAKTIKCDQKCNQYCLPTPTPALPTPTPTNTSSQLNLCPSPKKYSGFCIQQVTKACSPSDANFCCWYQDPCSVPTGWKGVTQ